MQNKMFQQVNDRLWRAMGFTEKPYSELKNVSLIIAFGGIVLKAIFKVVI